MTARSLPALYGEDFAADPERAYAALRQAGPLVRVEIAPGVEAVLATDYETALDVLRDTHTFGKDPRPWPDTVPADSPVRSVLAYRPAVTFADGETHARYRKVIGDSLALLGPHLLQRQVSDAAADLIGRFAGTGRADLVADYAVQIPLRVFSQWFGLPHEEGERLARTHSTVFDLGEDAHAAHEDLTGAIRDLVADRRARPQRDLTSYLLQHPAELDDAETVRQIAVAFGSGHELTANLVANTLQHMIADPRYDRSVYAGAMTAHEAINEVLWRNPPQATSTGYYVRYDTTFHGVGLRAGQLVLVSYAAANTSSRPGGATTDPWGASESAHLAWGAGPHSCPARQPALLIAITAIEELTSRLCDMEQSVPTESLRWRPGPFYRALAALPVTFTPWAPKAPAPPDESAGGASAGRHGAAVGR
ncbi:cytochrome P450 [Streptomyces sp. NRRL F-5123]|uniref:cytochrome P450 n=1 Tax=Streptomyces sp. NRRL F-5123 TaxID=1463856 RepID=UPI00069364C1|nr:cytochrome P450 [Streptomyces sp. NRRL F-5123]